MIRLRIYARNSQDNDPITSPQVEGTVGIWSTNNDTLIPLMTDGTLSYDAPNIFLNNKAFIDFYPVPRNGIYQVTFWREGYITKTQNLSVEATFVGERVDKRVIMSPELTPGQTRIIYTWQEDDPMDMDLYVTAIKKDDDNDVCMIFYANKNCPGTTQDR